MLNINDQEHSSKSLSQFDSMKKPKHKIFKKRN
jgi:hypothetical protein